MQMALGQFVFELGTLPFEELRRSSSWRHPSNSRVGARPARQFLGPGDDTITFSGWFAPELAGQPSSLAELRSMADSGQSWPLVSGTGEVFGAFVIESLQETGSLHLLDGSPRKISFELQLARVDDDQSGEKVNVDESGEYVSESKANSGTDKNGNTVGNTTVITAVDDKPLPELP